MDDFYVWLHINDMFIDKLIFKKTYVNAILLVYFLFYPFIFIYLCLSGICIYLVSVCVPQIAALGRLRTVLRYSLRFVP